MRLSARTLPPGHPEIFVLGDIVSFGRAQHVAQGCHPVTRFAADRAPGTAVAEAAVLYFDTGSDGDD